MHGVHVGVQWSNMLAACWQHADAGGHACCGAGAPPQRSACMHHARCPARGCEMYSCYWLCEQRWLRAPSTLCAWARTADMGGDSHLFQLNAIQSVKNISHVWA